MECHCPHCEARRQRRYIIRQHPENPRCVECGAEILLGVESTKLQDDVADDSDGAFLRGDLLCFFCADAFNRPPNEPSVYCYGRC